MEQNLRANQIVRGTVRAMAKTVKVKAHVICCNDAVEFVYIGEIRDARAKMQELKKIDRGIERGRGRLSSEAYENIFRWRIHTVDAEIGAGFTKS